MSLDRQGIRHQVMWELGECCRVIFAVHKKDQLKGPPYRWAVQSHTDVDGVGGIYKIFQKEGVNVTSLPALKKTEKPNWIKRLIYFYRYMKYCSGYNIHYKKTVDWDLIKHPENLCYSFFSKKTSDKINGYIEENKISSTAFFLEIADRVNREFFLTKESERKWIVPVNMRGPFGQKLDARNIFASVVFRFFPSEKVDDQLIQDKFKFYLKSKFHWGSWVSGLIQAYMGHDRLKKLAAKYPKAVFGLFSNVGKWPENFIEGDCPIHLAVMPVVSRVSPVGVVLMEFNGQYQIANMLHPCIDGQSDTTKKLLTEMIKSSLAKIGLNSEDLARELEEQEVKEFKIAEILAGGLTNG